MTRGLHNHGFLINASDEDNEDEEEEHEDAHDEDAEEECKNITLTHLTNA